VCYTTLYGEIHHKHIPETNIYQLLKLLAAALIPLLLTLFIDKDGVRFTDEGDGSTSLFTATESGVGIAAAAFQDQTSWKRPQSP
jgi:hypothetical protein